MTQAIPELSDRMRDIFGLVVDSYLERGLPVGALPFHGAGWQVHLEDLGRALALDGPAHADGWSEEKPAPEWHARWTELTPAYRGSDV